MKSILVFLILCACVIPAWGGDYAPAREAINNANTAEQAMQAAILANDLAKAEQCRQQAEASRQEARKRFEDAGITQEADPAALSEYADLQAAEGDYDLAAESLAKAIKAAPEDAALWAKRGQNLFKAGTGFRKEAFTALQKSLDLDDASANAATANLAMGDLYRAEGLPAQAREQYEKALALRPDDVRGKIFVAAMKIRDGQVVEGSKELDALGRAAQPYDAETRVLLRDVLAEFEQARRWFPDTAENHAAYAKIMYRAARLLDALMAAQRATQLNPKDFETWNFLAAMYGQTGNAAQARAAYERSLEANPDQHEIREALSSLPTSGN